MAKLVRDDAIVFLEHAIDHYERHVQGYRATLIKRERIDGSLRPAERIEVHFRQVNRVRWVALVISPARIVHVADVHHVPATAADVAVEFTAIVQHVDVAGILPTLAHDRTSTFVCTTPGIRTPPGSIAPLLLG